MHNRLRVKNIQHYRVGRAGFVFGPKREREVEVKTRQQYREIKACVYLQILEETDLTVSDDERAATPTTAPQLPLHATKDDPDLYRWMVELFEIQPAQARALWMAGYQDVEALRGADPDALVAVPGVGPASVDKIRATFDDA